MFFDWISLFLDNEKATSYRLKKERNDSDEMYMIAEWNWPPLRCIPLICIVYIHVDGRLSSFVTTLLIVIGRPKEQKDILYFAFNKSYFKRI